MERLSSSASGVSLRQLLRDAQFFGADDIRVQSCTSDSRHCRPGDLFVALPGSRRDGHDFAADALARGAGCPGRPSLKWHRRSHLLCSRYARCARPVVPGAGQGSVAATAGDWGHRHERKNHDHALDRRHPVGRRSPLGGAGHARLLRRICRWPCQLTRRRRLPHWPLGSRMEANDCSHAVLEVSSHALAQHRLSGVKVDIACITNVRHDHFDYHGTSRRYIAAKARLLELLAPEGVAIVNGDDAGSATCASRYDGPLVTVGVDAPAEITATLLCQFPSEQTFLLDTGSESVPSCFDSVGPP